MIFQEQEIYNKTKEFMITSFEQAGKSSKINHHLRTAALVQILYPDAGIPLLIAAVVHDIEKAFRMPDALKEKEGSGLTDSKFLRMHEERGAEIIGNFLHELGAEKSFIQEVKKIVSRHEEGGDINEDILQAADSVSFFEDEELGNIEKMLRKEKTPSGIDDVKSKIQRMYDRITIPQAKEMARPGYEKSLEIMKNF